MNFKHAFLMANTGSVSNLAVQQYMKNDRQNLRIRARLLA